MSITFQSSVTQDLALRSIGKRLFLTMGPHLLKHDNRYYDKSSNKLDLQGMLQDIKVTKPCALSLTLYSKLLVQLSYCMPAPTTQRE